MILRSTITRCLRTLPTDQRKSVTDTLCREISREFGGTTIYITMRNHVYPDELRQMYNGWNVPQLVRHFRISRSRVYQTLNEQPR